MISVLKTESGLYSEESSKQNTEFPVGGPQLETDKQTGESYNKTIILLRRRVDCRVFRVITE